MMGRGRPFGVKLLAERVRWEVAYHWGEQQYKLNNNLTSYVARQLVHDLPALKPYLKFRKTRW
jgi:hypothetical protein